MTMYSEPGDEYRARYQNTDVTRPLNSVSRVCDQRDAARASNPAHLGRKFTKAVEDDKDVKQVSYDYCFVRDPPGMEPAKILVLKDRATRMVSAHVVPLQRAVIDWVIQQS